MSVVFLAESLCACSWWPRARPARLARHHLCRSTSRLVRASGPTVSQEFIFSMQSFMTLLGLEARSVRATRRCWRHGLHDRRKPESPCAQRVQLRFARFRGGISSRAAGAARPCALGGTRPTRGRPSVFREHMGTSILCMAHLRGEHRRRRDGERSTNFRPSHLPQVSTPHSLGRVGGTKIPQRMLPREHASTES